MHRLKAFPACFCLVSNWKYDGEVGQAAFNYTTGVYQSHNLLSGSNGEMRKAQEKSHSNAGSEIYPDSGVGWVIWTRTR
jgi:hypothetical protein